MHEASYVRWYDFYVRNGETAEAAEAMARYQAGESQYHLCSQLDTGARDPDDMTGQPVLAPGSASHPDPPFHTTDADGHNDDSDPDDTDAAAAPGATADGGHAATDEEHATPPRPLTMPLPAPDAGLHQHAQSTAHPGSTATNPPLHSHSNPTRRSVARRPPTTPLQLPLSPTPPPRPTPGAVMHAHNEPSAHPHAAAAPKAI